ncbi:MerR family transcriptional regulator [Actinospica sp. MGRD01-02]|uniref:MerR family transcriptional regulator n=1 Tax=Actinospica acidithermotolerans TaxID=2828514 RepID=A0A941IKM6_9ACTN|nr:helix-turn-helix domain-containing protein [Actinospica acidithermotolerans]MBR7830774.1 MerR family transcriptional regulator [Actinospica acidithermotolerans]
MSLISIGEFAQASRLSPKALRLYDELGLLVPARVDGCTGYRWYAPGQLERARLVSALRRIGMPLARIKLILDQPPETAAEQVRAHWSATEIEHAARGELAGLLVNRLLGERSAMFEVEVRRLPERRVLSMIRRVHQEELIERSRELFIRPFQQTRWPRPQGEGWAPFMVFHGEVSSDSDGPVEWCRPVPDETAEQIAALFPGYELSTDPAHEEAFVRQPETGAWTSGTQAELALQELRTWAIERRREPAGPVRMVLVAKTPSDAAGPDTQFAVPLR